MVQEIKWAGTKDWQEWLWLWEKNEKGEFSKDGTANSDIAIGLLHMGPKMIVEIHYGRVEQVKFYLKIASMERWRPGSQSSSSFSWKAVGDKAYQILVSDLLPNPQFMKPNGWYIGSDPKKINLFKEIIRFFAYSRRDFQHDLKPYCSHGRKFVTNLHLALTLDGYSNSFSPESRKILLEQKEDLVRALVNVGAYDHISVSMVIEAVPILEEKISYYLWNCNPGEMVMTKNFPNGEREWREALENLKPKATRFAFYYNEIVAQTLIYLLIKQVKIK